MRQQIFESRYREEWRYLENLLGQLDTFKKKDMDAAFPERYRRLCSHLTLARQRHYSPQLIQYLNNLVTEGHQVLYAGGSVRQNLLQRFFWIDFPEAIRRNTRLILIAFALFWIPAIIFGIVSYHNTDALLTLVDANDLREIDSMYDPDQRAFGRGQDRQADSDLVMFAHYISNNIGISFRTFAGGMLLGIGSLLITIFNGLYIGGIAGHMTQIGYSHTFFPFVIGHGAFELPGLIFSAAAGLKLGMSLIDPGPLRRKDSLKLAAHEAAILMYGSFAMLLIAAFLEAFWSARVAIPISVKLTVGALLWLLVIGYCVRAGNRHAA